MPELQAGDLVFVKNHVTGWRTTSRWLISFLIRHMSTQHGEGPTFANHVCTVHGPHKVWRGGGFVVEDYAIYEAMGRDGFCKRWLREQYENGHTDIVVYRDTTLTNKDRIRVKACHVHLRGKRYPKTLIGAHSIDYGATKLWQSMGGTGECRAARWLYHQFVNRKQNVDYPMCSWAVGYMWDVWLKRPFSIGYKVATPDDLMDECQDNDKWQRVFTYRKQEG
ncbi:MAG: hypothetical protein KOO60_11075 [Gemmatimonadales bacterium]|nr:hypothetical protein [Gemmatimonadales bacterium]